MINYPNRIWLVRHAITTAPTVLNGAESDVPLSGLGHHQAEALASWFCGLAPEVVYSSTMKRAIQTALPIAAMCRIPHHVVGELHERSIGALSGMEFSVNFGPWAETLNAWAQGNTAYTTPGAESYDDLVARLLPAWNRVMQLAAGKRAVIVLHGIVIKVLLLTLLSNHGSKKWQTLGRVQNVSITELIQTSADLRANSLLYVPEPVQKLNAREHKLVKNAVG